VSSDWLSAGVLDDVRQLPLSDTWRLLLLPESKMDPIEQTPEYKAIEEELDQKIRSHIGEGAYLGYCHIYWLEKKLILKYDYGMEWKSPPELNPRMFFD